MQRRHPRVWLVLCASALGGACTQDFDSFQVVDGSGAAPATGGAGATSTGGAGGVDPSTGGMGADASTGGATTGGATTGGTGGTGDGGSAGAPPTGCAISQLRCGSDCVDIDNQNCGACNNDCTAQGLVCVQNRCGCSAAVQCGGSDPICRPAATCRCSGAQSGDCTIGEVCSGTVCNCNGGAKCGLGLTCCPSPTGCVDTKIDASNCGGCGRACAQDQTCNNSQCI